MRQRGPFQSLFADATLMQIGRLDPESFRELLDTFYATTDRTRLLEEIEFEERRKQLKGPCAYKVNIHHLKGDPRPGTAKNRFTLWGRRFGLFRRIGIRSDIIILREGEQIPPHGHERVISGFYVAEGRIHLRHYHRDQIEGDRVYLRKAIDEVCEPGGFGTNSDRFQNVHWLAGLAPSSFLLRFTVSDIPGPGEVAAPANDRIYIDPTAKPDSAGVIQGRIVTEQHAKALRITGQ